jgi:hypothetical protein
LIAPLGSLVRVAELPQSRGCDGHATYPDIKPEIAEGEGSMALRIIEGDRHFEMIPAGRNSPIYYELS